MRCELQAFDGLLLSVGPWASMHMHNTGYVLLLEQNQGTMVECRLDTVNAEKIGEEIIHIGWMELLGLKFHIS